MKTLLLLSVLFTLTLGTIIFLYKTYDWQLNLPLLSSAIAIIYFFAAMRILRKKKK